MEPLKTEDKLIIYRIAGWCTVLMLLIIPAQIMIFIIWPMPANSGSWMEMFKEHPAIAFLHLDFLYLINNILICLMYLGIFISLLKEQAGLALIALVLGLVGVAAYFPGVRAMEMLKISQQYFISEDTIRKTALLSVADGMISVWQGSGFLAYYLLNGFSLLFFSLAMMKSLFFGKAISITAFIAAILMMIPSTIGNIGLVFSLLSLIPWVIFSFFLAIRFFQESRHLSLNYKKKDPPDRRIQHF